MSSYLAGTADQNCRLLLVSTAMHRSPGKIYDRDHSGQWPDRRMGGPSAEQSFRPFCRCIGINDHRRCRRLRDDGNDDVLTSKVATTRLDTTQVHSWMHHPLDNDQLRCSTQFIGHYFNSHPAHTNALNCLTTWTLQTDHLPAAATDQPDHHPLVDKSPNDGNSARIRLFCMCRHCKPSKRSNLSSELSPPKPHHHASLCLISIRLAIAATLTCHHRPNNVPSIEPSLQGPTDLKSAAMNINELCHRFLFFFFLLATRFLTNLSYCAIVLLLLALWLIWPIFPQSSFTLTNSICLLKSNKFNTFPISQGHQVVSSLKGNYTHTCNLPEQCHKLANHNCDNDTNNNLNNSSKSDLFVLHSQFNRFHLHIFSAILLCGNLSSTKAPHRSALVNFFPLLIHQLFELMTLIFYHHYCNNLFYFANAAIFIKIKCVSLFGKLPCILSENHQRDLETGSTNRKFSASNDIKEQSRDFHWKFPIIFQSNCIIFFGALLNSIYALFIFQIDLLISPFPRTLMRPYQQMHQPILAHLFSVCKCLNMPLFSMINCRAMATVIQYNKLLPFHLLLNAAIAAGCLSGFTFSPVHFCSLIFKFLNAFKNLLTLSSSLYTSLNLSSCQKLFSHYGQQPECSAKMLKKNHFSHFIFLFFILIQSGFNQNAEAANSLVSVTSSIASQPEHKTYPDLNVLIGHTARLPCDFSTPGQVDQPVMEQDLDHRSPLLDQHIFRSAKTTPNPDPYAASDPVQLVLWYHGDDISGSPFYSVDARHSSVDQRNKAMQMMSQSSQSHSGEASQAEPKLKHFVVPPYSDRASFELKHHQPANKPAILTIQSAQESDAGLYWCRVDYRWTRTTISKVRLNVLVPPKRLSMYRLAPADSTVELFPAVSSRLGESSAWQVSQLLSSIRSVNSSALSYVPIGPTDSLTESALHPFDAANSQQPLPAVTSSRHLLLAHELTSTVLYLDEGIDTLFGCEAIGGNPLATVSWQRNNRKLIPERVIVRNVDTGVEVVTPSGKQATRQTDNLPSKSKQMASSVSAPAQNHTANELGNRQVIAQVNDTASATNKSVLSLVLIEAPTRHDIGAILQCRATNIDAQKPIIRVIKLDVNLRPTKAVIVDMQRADQSLTAGSTVYVTCLTWGSRPAAKIRWFLREKQLLDVKEIVFEGNSTTKSTVRLVLNAFDNGAHLRCVAENPNAPLSAVPSTSISQSIAPPGDDFGASTTDRHHQRHHQQQSMNSKMSAFDQITLLVKFLPNVTIKAIDADLNQPNPKSKFPTTLYSVKEGHKLTLNCKVDSNPEPFKIRWLQNRKEIFPSVQKGILLQNHNHTLVVNAASRYQEGRYQCVVYNTLGRGDSKEIGIYILRSPRCALPPLSTIESSLQYPTNIFCQVDANPMDNVAIYWQTPQNILLSRDGKIIRVKPTASQGDANQKLQNSLDEFDPENEYDVEEDDQGSGSSKRRLNRLLIASKGVRSRLTIVPQSISDFGIYRCWAENAIGSNQNDPCLFNLTSKATNSISPKPVHNCVTNYTQGYLSIRCLHNAINASAPGAKQFSLLSAYSSLAEKHLKFHLEIHEISGLDGSVMELIANQTNPLEPIFFVQSLTANSIYQINVYASNPYGVSDKVTMLFQTNNAATNMTMSSSLVLSSSKPSTIDDWLMGGALPSGYDDESHSNANSPEDEDVSGSELNFDLERVDHRNDAGNANDQWSISKPDLQKQNRLSDSGDVGSNHRVLVILITVLAASFIIFSILVSIAIGLCVYRNKRDNARGNQSNQANGNQVNQTSSNSKPNTPKISNKSQHSSPVAKICTYENHHHTTLSTPDLIPCDGVLIFNPSSDISNSSTAHFSNTVAAVAYGPNSNPASAIYRDFVSLDSDSSYANYTASDTSGAQQGPSMTLHTLDPVSIANEPAVEPKFLCQPNHVSILNDLNTTGFISGQGNVQLVTTAPAYSIESASSGAQKFSSPFHLVNGPFLSIQTQPNTLGHSQHQRHNPTQFNQSQLLFMGKANQLMDDHSSGQSQINSSFSLVESPSDMTYHPSNHLTTFPHALDSSKPPSNTGPPSTSTITTEDGDIIQATTV